MKIRILFILVLIVIIGNQLLTAQNVIAKSYFPFPDSNAVWTEVYELDWGEHPTSYCFALKNKDTLINSVKYHKIYQSNDLTFSESGGYGFMRQDTISKQVFYRLIYQNGFITEEHILYDFSLCVGDTVSMKKGYNTHDVLVVSEIDTVLISGKYRKRINIERCCGHVYQWIEGIGCTDGLFTSMMYDVTTCSCRYYLLCFAQNDQWIYHNFMYYKTCVPTTNDRTEVQKETGIALYPNPIQKISYLKLGTACKKLEIVNSMGVVVKSYNVENLEEIPISKNDFVSGMYLYRLYSNTSYIKSGKFIIN